MQRPNPESGLDGLTRPYQRIFRRDERCDLVVRCDGQMDQIGPVLDRQVAGRRSGGKDDCSKLINDLSIHSVRGSGKGGKL